MRTTPRLFALVAGLVILSSALAATPAPPIKPDAAHELATQACLFAYPLVLMERTRAAAPNRPSNDVRIALSEECAAARERFLATDDL